MFWPTYKDLSTAAELRDAATSPRRFIKAYEKWAPYKYLGMQTKNTFEVKLPLDIDDIRHLYLVPGGRYLSLQEQGRLTLWDLWQPGTSSNVLEPKLALESDIPPSHVVESVEDSTVLRFLVKTQSEIEDPSVTAS